MKKQNRFPKGWNEARVRAVIQHYEGQTESEAVAEDEAVFRRRDQAVMVVPKELVPRITKLITREAKVAARRRQNNSLQPTSRAQRKGRVLRNSRAARG
jgi:hypothetical protein